MSNTEKWKTWEGRVVDGKFRLRQWLGGSDHGAVFLTERQGQPSEKVAIKLIKVNAEDADRRLSRWREAAQLSHPHLLRIFETGRCQIDNTPLLYVVMEYAEEDLSQILPQRPLTPSEVSDLLPPLLDAFSYLHARGFAHARIKPSNVLAVGDQLKLSPDQITSAKQPAPDRKRLDIYDAPEAATGILSPAGDVWSLGVTLVAAITQNVSFAEDTSPNDPRVPETIPDPFRGIARECLHVDPKRRCSVAEIQARLQPEARSVPAAPEAPPPVPRRTSRRIIFAALLVVAVAVGFVVFHSRAKNGQTKTVPTQTSETPRQTTPNLASAPTPPAREPAEPPKKEASSRGEVIHQVLPDVPQSAKDTITGTIKVSVRVEVDSSGKVTAVKLTHAGPSQYFANLALSAARGWEFAAPQANGQPAASVWTLQFRFRRTSTQVSPKQANR